MRPLPTGSATPTVTIGIARVACIAANADGVEVVMITSTGEPSIPRRVGEPFGSPVHEVSVNHVLLAFDVGRRSSLR